MLSTREEQFLRGELDHMPKEYLANIRSNLKRKLLVLQSDLQLIRGNKRIPVDLRKGI